MSTHAIKHRDASPARMSAVAAQQVRWLAGGLALGFLVPFVFADQLNVQRDLYYGIYAVSVAVFFVLWARATGQSIAEMVRRRWLLAVALGLGCAALLALMVLRVEDATTRPDNLTVAGAVLWRGVVYGATDGLLLSAFPILAVFAAFAGTRLRTADAGQAADRLRRDPRLTRHDCRLPPGYSDFRSSQLRSPMTGDVVWSVPTLVTLNPIGAPIAHIGLHTSAVLHSYNTDLFLPPHE